MLNLFTDCFQDHSSENSIVEVEHVKHFTFNAEDPPGTGFICWYSNGTYLSVLITDDDYKNSTAMFLLYPENTMIGKTVLHAAWDTEVLPYRENLFYGAKDLDVFMSFLAKDEVTYATIGIKLDDGTYARIVAFNHDMRIKKTVVFDFNVIRESKRI